MNEAPKERWYPRRAVDAWDIGMSVVRLQEPRQGDPETGKATVGRWKPLQTVRLTRREAEAITGQYGIITGAVSGVAVVDVDREDLLDMVLEELANTPMRTKTAKGWHLFYRHPGVVVGNRAKLRKLPLDVRGDGGYVVGPGSFHWSGRRYEAVGDWSNIENLPVFDPAWLEEKRKFKQSTIDTNCDRATLIRRAIAYLAKLEPAVSGQHGHSKMLYAATCLVGKFGLSYSESLPILLIYNMRAEPPFDDKSVERKLAEAIKNLGAKRSEIIKTIGG